MVVLRRTLFALSVLAAMASQTVAQVAPAPMAPTPPDQAGKLFIELPRTYNTTDSMALGPHGRVIVAVPNYNNLSIAKQGRDSASSPATDS